MADTDNDVRRAVSGQQAKLMKDERLTRDFGQSFRSARSNASQARRETAGENADWRKRWRQVLSE